MTSRNPQRIAQARAAINAYRTLSGSEYDDTLTDLMADLMHWADEAGFCFDLAVECARLHFDAEVVS